MELLSFVLVSSKKCLQLCKSMFSTEKYPSANDFTRILRLLWLKRDNQHNLQSFPNFFKIMHDRCVLFTSMNRSYKLYNLEESTISKVNEIFSMYVEKVWYCI